MLSTAFIGAVFLYFEVNIMSVYEELHYKDSSPDATVDRLLKILHECGIDTEEAWGDKSSVDTYSLRVAIKGTTIGTNGKGVTE